MALEQDILDLINNGILDKSVDTNGEKIFTLSSHTTDRLMEALRQNNCILSYLNEPILTPAKEIVMRVFEDAELAETPDGDIILDATNGNLTVNLMKVKVNRIIIQVELDEGLFIMQGKALEDIIISRIIDAFTSGINKKFINDLSAQGVAYRGSYNGGFAGVMLTALKSNNGFVLVSRAFLNDRLGVDDFDKELLSNPKVHLFENDGQAIIVAVEDKNAIEVYKGTDQIEAGVIDSVGFLSNTKVFGARASYGFLVKNPKKVRAVVVTP